MKRIISVILFVCLFSLSLSGCYVYTKEPPEPLIIISPEGPPPAPPSPPPAGTVGPAR